MSKMSKSSSKKSVAKSSKIEVLSALYGHLPDPLKGHRARIEDQEKAAKKTRLGRYRVQILGTYLVARGDDLDALRSAASKEVKLLGCEHMVELIDLKEFMS